MKLQTPTQTSSKTRFEKGFALASVAALTAAVGYGLGTMDRPPADPASAAASRAPALPAPSGPDEGPAADAPSPDPDPNADPAPMLGRVAIAAWAPACAAPPCADAQRRSGVVSIRDRLGELARPALNARDLELELPPGDYSVALIEAGTQAERARQDVIVVADATTRADLRVED